MAIKSKVKNLIAKDLFLENTNLELSSQKKAKVVTIEKKIKVLHLSAVLLLKTFLFLCLNFPKY